MVVVGSLYHYIEDNLIEHNKNLLCVGQEKHGGDNTVRNSSTFLVAGL